MKKNVLFAVLAMLLAAAIYIGGFKCGAVHALENMELWASQEWEIQWDADGKPWYRMDETSEYDGTVDIYYDGEWYVHNVYVG